jgi:hypothetical protein
MVAPGPGTGLVTPLTVLSDQGAFARETVIDPKAEILSTKIRSFAELTSALVAPGGNFVKSNCSKPSELFAPPTSITGCAP